MFSVLWDLVDRSHSPDRTDFPSIIDESDVSLSRSVALADAHVSEAPQEFLPRVGSDPVPQRQTHAVITLSVSLQTQQTLKHTLSRDSSIKNYKSITLPHVLPNP